MDVMNKACQFDQYVVAESLEDTKGTIRGHKSKDIQYNSQNTIFRVIVAISIF